MSTSESAATTSTKRPVVLLACGSFNPVTYMHLRLFERARDYLERNLNIHVMEGILSPVSDDYKPREGKELASASQRLNMLQLALTDSDWLRVDVWESSRPEWTRTLQVLRHVQDEISSTFVPRSPEQQLTNGPVNNNNNKNGRLPLENHHPISSSSSSDSGSSTTVTSPTEMAADNHVFSPSNSAPPRVMLLGGADFLKSFAVPGLWEPADIESIVRDHGLIVISRCGFDSQRFIHESDLLSKYEKNIHLVPEWIPNEISSTEVRRAISRGESVKYLIPDSVIRYIRENGLFKSVERGRSRASKMHRTTSLRDNADQLVVELRTNAPQKSPVSGQSPVLSICSSRSSPIWPKVGLSLVPDSPRGPAFSGQTRHTSSEQSANAQSVPLLAPLLKDDDNIAHQSITPKEATKVCCGRPLPGLVGSDGLVPNLRRASVPSSSIFDYTSAGSNTTGSGSKRVRLASAADERVTTQDLFFKVHVEGENKDLEPSSSTGSGVVGQLSPGIGYRPSQKGASQQFREPVNGGISSRPRSLTPSIRVSKSTSNQPGVTQAITPTDVPHYATLRSNNLEGIGISRPKSYHGGEGNSIDDTLDLLNDAANEVVTARRGRVAVHWANQDGVAASDGRMEPLWVPVPVKPTKPEHSNNNDMTRTISMPSNLQSSSRSHSMGNLVCHVAKFQISESPETTV